MEATNAQFKDYIGDSLKIASGLLKTVYQERSQLYESLIKLMLLTGTDSFEITAEEKDNRNGTYSIEFRPSEDGKSAAVVLVKHDTEIVNE